MEEWRQAFEEAKARAAATPKVGLMKLENAPGKNMPLRQVTQLYRNDTRELLNRLPLRHEHWEY